MKVNQRCRVCGRFLTEARERRRSSYKYREFADDLHSVFAINTGNDISHSPFILQISDGWKSSEEYIVYFALLIGQCTQQLSARRYHKIIMCTESMHVYMYVHVSLHWSFLTKATTTKVRWSTSQHKIVDGIRAVAPLIQMGFSLDEHSSNYPAILEQLLCLICICQPLELGAAI